MDFGRGVLFDLGCACLGAAVGTIFGLVQGVVTIHHMGVGAVLGWALAVGLRTWHPFGWFVGRRRGDAASEADD
jgi:hypothetical protein